MMRIRMFRNLLLATMLLISNFAVASQQLPKDVINSLQFLQDVTKVDKTILPASVLFEETLRISLEVAGNEYYLELIEDTSMKNAAVSWKGIKPAVSEEDQAIYYTGTVNNDSNSWAKIILKDGVYTGAFSVDSQVYFIEKKNKYFSDTGEVNFDKQTVMYNTSDVETGLPEHYGLNDQIFPNIVKSNFASETVDPIISQAIERIRKADIGLVADFEYFQKYGADTANRLKSILHIVNGIYERDLGITLNIVEIVVYSDSNDPFSDSTDSYALLDELANSYARHSIFSKQIDNAHFVSGKDLDSNIIGLAYVDTICHSKKSVSLTQDYVSFNNAQVLVTAHEMGHNFGATHDSSNDGRYIMWPSATSSVKLEFSERSKKEIISTINGAMCLDVVIKDLDAEFETVSDVELNEVVTSNETVLDLDKLCKPFDFTPPNPATDGTEENEPDIAAVIVNDKCIFSIEGDSHANAQFKINDGDFISGPYTFTRSLNDNNRYAKVAVRQDAPLTYDSSSTITLYVDSQFNAQGIVKPFTVITKEPEKYTVKAIAGNGGRISPSSRLVPHGDTTTFTVTPNTGYSISSVTGCNGSLNGNTYTTGAITNACTVSASFSINSYTVSAQAGAGGSIGPSSRLVNHGDTTSFTVAPSAGYSISSVTGCNGSLNGNTYTTGAITNECTVSASFSINSYTVSAQAEVGGSISPKSKKVNHGSTASFTITPDAGYVISTVTGCGGSLNGSTYTTKTITNACKVIASFAKERHTISTSTGMGGSINPTSKIVDHGDTATFVINVNDGYQIDTAKGCNGSLSGNSYTAGPVISECTIIVTFKEEPIDCVQYTETLEEHLADDRVWSEYTGGSCWGSFCWGGQWNIYTVGSDILISHNGKEIHTLHEMGNEKGIWYPGECPGDIDPVPPVVDSVAKPVVSKVGETADTVKFKVTITGTASDKNNDLKEVRVGAGMGSQVCSGTSEFTCVLEHEYLKSSLPATGEYVVVAYDKAENMSEAVTTEKVTFADTGACFTAKNADHGTAGRAYPCGFANLQGCAVGSDQNLGWGSYTTSLIEQSPDYWVKVDSCP